MTGKPDSVYTFIDNSNLFIEMKRIAKIAYAYDAEQIFRLRTEFGKLLEVVREGRDIGGTVLVGSRPPQADTLWAKLKNMGIQPKIFDRSSVTGREKGVDAEVVNAIRDVMEDNAVPGIIALIAGDGDYLSTLERCLKKRWKVEIYFWSNASSSLKRLPGARFFELDQYLPQISFVAPERPRGTGEGRVGEEVTAYGGAGETN